MSDINQKSKRRFNSVYSPSLCQQEKHFRALCRNKHSSLWVLWPTFCFARSTERLPLASVQVKWGMQKQRTGERKSRAWQRTAAFHQRFVATSGKFNVTYARAYEHFENSLKFSFHRNNHSHHNKHLVFIITALLPFVPRDVVFVISILPPFHPPQKSVSYDFFRWHGLKTGAMMKISWKRNSFGNFFVRSLTSRF